MLCKPDATNNYIWIKITKSALKKCILGNFYKKSDVSPSSQICYTHRVCVPLNSSPHEQNDHHFADNIFWCIFVNEMFHVLIKISLKFVSRNPIDNKPALVQVMAWRRLGNKPLSGPMLTQFTDAYMQHYGRWFKLDIELQSHQFMTWSFSARISLRN